MAKSFDALVRQTTSKRVRQKAARRAEELMAEMLLSEMRKGTGKSQSELAKALHIKQPSLSKLENQSDMQISTLGKIVEALGGQLEVVAKFPTRKVKITQFGKQPAGRRRTPAKKTK